MFKLPKEYEEQLKREHEMKYITLEDGTEKHVSKFQDEEITFHEYKNMKMNSYTRNEIYPKLNDYTLIEEAKYYISQCSKPSSIVTYNDALIHLILPELIERYEMKVGVI